MMLTQLTALRGVLANGGNIHECQAALITVTDELETPADTAGTGAKAEKTEQPKSEDKSKGKSEEKTAAAPKPSGKKKYLSGSALRILKRVPHIHRSIPRINSISRNILSTI